MTKEIKAYDTNPWTEKETRKHKAIAHTQLMDRLYSSQIDVCAVNTEIYSNLLTVKYRGCNPDMKISLLDADTVSAARNNAEGKTAVLNFASYKIPGGMFIEGSIAQEEALCHESFLYNVLGQKTDYYAWNNQHKNKALYTNRALYSPKIIFTKEDGAEDFKCDVITCAAPNYTTAKKYLHVSEKENKDVLVSRCKYVLDIAEDNGVDTLILGAWGSGVFGQDAGIVASIFSNLLNAGTYGFSNVIFAVPKGKNGNYDKIDAVAARECWNEGIVTSSIMANIVALMDDNLREQIHGEYAPCSNMRFLKEYRKKDPSFEDVLFKEFSTILW